MTATATGMSIVQRHTLSVLALDQDGIISRISGLFTRRAFTMESITSAETNDPGINRITIVVNCDDRLIEQIIKQLNKLVQVLKITRLDGDNTIARALMLVKVTADATTRPQIVDAAKIFRARVVDVAPDSVVIEATGSQGKLHALREVLVPFGIKELIESGQIALARGSKTLG